MGNACYNQKATESWQVGFFFIFTYVTVSNLWVKAFGKSLRIKYLDLAQFSSALHPAGYVHSVSPDVVLWLACSDHPCYYRPVVYSCTNTQPTCFENT